MSWAIVARVLKTKVGSPSGKAVLLALANHCDVNGKSCYPGQETIQQITELSVDTIQRQIKALIEGKFISGTKVRKKGHWASWDYQINLSMLWEDQTATCGMVAAEHQAAPHGMAKPHGAVRPSRTMRLKPSIKPFNDPSRAKAPSSLDGLGALGAPLRKRIGRDKFEAWFGGATIAESTEDSVTLELPSNFRARHVEDKFGADVLACCRAHHATIERVKFTARAAA
jgi:Helix-turn-helix domain